MCFSPSAEPNIGTNLGPGIEWYHLKAYNFWITKILDSKQYKVAFAFDC